MFSEIFLDEIEKKCPLEHGSRDLLNRSARSDDLNQLYISDLSHKSDILNLLDTIVDQRSVGNESVLTYQRQREV